MKAVVQRVLRAAVTVDGEIVGQIGPGLLVLLGVGQADTESDADYLADKIAALRIFEDASEKMNLSVRETGGAMLVVSQFTLLANTRKGRRPSFERAAPPEQAKRLYERFVGKIAEVGIQVETGRFQTRMIVELVNDGPVTLICDSPIATA